MMPGMLRLHADGAVKERVADVVTRVSRKSHDTISMVALDKEGNIAAGSSTNGASHKVPCHQPTLSRSASHRTSSPSP